MKVNLRPRFFLLLAMFAFLVTLVSSYYMWTRPLWGYAPLAWLLGCWALMVGLAHYRYQRKGRSAALRRLGLSSLSGLLLALGFPDLLPLPFLLLVAWVPLLVLEQELAATGNYSKGLFLGHVFNTVFLWNVLSTYWVMNTAFVAGLFANIVNSLLMCVPWLLFVYSKQVMPRIGYLALVAYWLSFEYGHMQWELTWPWLTLGNGWAEYPALVQWYEFTGVFGGSLWIWWANILALRWYQRWQAGQPSSKAKWQFAALALLPMLVSIIQYLSYQEDGETIDVVVVQPNYEPHFEKFAIPEREQAQRFIELSLTKMDSLVDYLVFPETSFGFVRERDPWNYAPLQQIRRALADYPRLKIVTGLNAYHDFSPGETPSGAVRYRTRANQQIAFEVINLAAQLPIDPAQSPQTYRKSKLVPGAESFPFKDLFFFMEPLVHQLGGSTAGLGTQPEREAFTSEVAAVAPVICYESIFGEYFADYIRKPASANVVFIMTNDGWWDHTAGHRQHLAFASLRAIETRRAIARSANTGISAFINQRGDIEQPTAYEEAVAIRQKIYLNSEETFYVRWGDLIARVAIFTSIILLLNTFVKSRLAKQKA